MTHANRDCLSGRQCPGEALWTGPGAKAVLGMLEQIATTDTATITQVEVTAALAKAVRMSVLTSNQAASAMELFQAHLSAS